MVKTITSSKKNNNNGKKTYKRIEGDEKRLGNIFSYDDFKTNDTIIIESGTGTGKTHSYFDYVSKYMDEFEDCRMLSICAKRSLCTEHFKYIQKLKNPLYYLDLSEKTKIEQCNSVVCVNSLWKYSHYDDDLK